MIKNILFSGGILSVLLLCACSGPNTQNDRNGWTVTIPPLKYIVESITENDFPIEILLPSGATPETYEPTPAQMTASADSKLIFTIGLLDFEQQLSQRLARTDAENRIVNLSENIDLITGHEHPAHHGTGVDPHIWTSPKALKQIASTTFRQIALLYPDSTKYTANYQRLINRLDSLDRMLQTRFSTSDKKYFLSYHPAYTYMARDYGIEQLSLEEEGKEPSVDRMHKIISQARRDGIRVLFYQPQFSRAAVTAIASEIGAEAIEIDPLQENVIENLAHIAELITK